MDFSVLLSPGDRDTWSAGIFLLASWVYWLGMSLYFPYRKAKWLKKNPSFPDVIDKVFAAYSRGRFSILGILSYLVWLSLSLSLIIAGYLNTDARLGDFILCVMLATPFVTGFHFCVNRHFLNIIPTVNGAADRQYDVDPLLNIDKDDGFTSIVLGVCLMGLPIFLLSCAFLHFPCDLSTLLTMWQKWSQK